MKRRRVFIAVQSYRYVVYTYHASHFPGHTLLWIAITPAMSKMLLPFRLAGHNGHVLLGPPRRLVRRIDKWIKRLQLPRRVRRDDRRRRDRQIRVVWICTRGVLEFNGYEGGSGGNSCEGRLTGMLAGRFANPAKPVLALCQKRAERTRIDQIVRAKDLISSQKKGRGGVGSSARVVDWLVGGWVGREQLRCEESQDRWDVRRERHRTRTHSTRPPPY